MAEGRKAMGFHQLDYKIETKSSASQPFTLKAKVHRPWLSKELTWEHFLIKVMDSRKEFGSRQNRNPNYDLEAIEFF